MAILGLFFPGQLFYSEYGNIVKNEFLKIPGYHQQVLSDASIIMPNHVHCIITLGGYDFNNGVGVVDGNNYVGEIHEFTLPAWQKPSAQHHQNIDINQYCKQRRKMIIPKIL